MKQLFAIVVIGALITACTAQQAAQDVSIAVADAKCLFNAYSAAVAEGKTQEEAMAYAAVACGIIPAKANAFLTAHIAAEEKEKARAKP